MLLMSGFRVLKRAAQRSLWRLVGSSRKPLFLPGGPGAVDPPDLLLEMLGISTDRRLATTNGEDVDQRARCRADIPPIISFHWSLTWSYIGMNWRGS